MEALSVLLAFLLLSTSVAQNFRGFSEDLETPVKRLAPAAYDDGISTPRTLRTNGNGTLPGARTISNAISKQTESIAEPSGLNNLFWSWAQFVDHDMALIHEGEERLDIDVPEGDGRFDTIISQIPFKRSAFMTTRRIKSREQINSITPIIDASMVYGSNETLARELRANRGSSPFLEEGPGGFPKLFQGTFVAGDSRVAEQPGLSTIHGLFVREHNRLVSRFIEEVGMTDNETIYETARLIVGNEIQRITFNEYLPKILGPNSAKQIRYQFRAGARPFIFNEFTAACYRYGHTMVSERLAVADGDFCAISDQSINLREAFFNTTVSLDRGLDNILRGLLIMQAEKVDVQVVNTLRDFLFFGQKGITFGLDLASLNIQRGRDHGLASYCSVRRALRMSTDLSYMQVTGGDAELSEMLEDLYGPDPCDMDLWVAGLAERKARGSILGSTCRAVIRRQFDSLFRADKFHIANMDYSEYGLQADPILDGNSGIRLGTVTLADIIRLNTAVRPPPGDIFMRKDQGSSCS